MEKITDYHVASGGDANGLAVTVNGMINQGWQPFGSITILDKGSGNMPRFTFVQPIVKYEVKK